MLDSLYADIGEKIKNWAKWIFVTEAIGAIIAGLVLASNSEGVWSVLTICFGPLVALVSTWLLYAFGELVADMHAMRYNSRNIDKNVQVMAAPSIREAGENARLETEVRSSAKATEAEAEREARENARREARERARREARESARRAAEGGELTLAEKLEYSLNYSTDEGIISYLKNINDEAVQNILRSPANVRDQVQELLSKLQ